MWRKMKLNEVLTNRDVRFKPGDKAIENLKRIDKINFSGQIFLSDKTSNTDMILVKNGDLVISGINVEKGAIAVYEGIDDITATIHYSSYVFDEEKIDVEFLKIFLRSPDLIELLKQQVPGGIKTEIKPKHILALEVFFPSDLYIQRKIAKKFFEKETTVIKLKEHLTHQLNLTTNLSQAILLEALQGKLVKQEFEEESAAELLKRIKSQKEKLIKKEKVFLPVKAEERPFEIPNTWEWCRLGEVTNIQRGSSPRPKGDSRYFSKTKTALNWITISDISNFCKENILLQTKEYLTLDGSKQSRYVNSNEFIIAVSGSTTGKCCITGIEGFIYDGLAVAKIIDNGIDPRFLLNYMMCLYSTINNSKAGASFPNINTDYLNNLAFPLPPLAEQKRINQEINKQLAHVDLLKQNIVSNSGYAEQLLKTLLHEAFEIKETHAEIIEFKPGNVDYYRRTVLAAEIVWQLHKEPTLGHLKLQKLIYLCQKSANMQLPTNFLRQAMGPYDNRLMRSIDKQFKEKKWFEYKKEQLLKYEPLSNAGSHHQDFKKYFSSESESIQSIIDTFKTIKSDVVEIVATVYACIDQMLDENIVFSEALLLQRFYEWSEEKQKFSEQQVKRVFSRMKDTGLIPKGFTAVMR